MPRTDVPSAQLQPLPSSSMSFLCAASNKCWPIGTCMDFSLPSFSDTNVTEILQDSTSKHRHKPHFSQHTVAANG